MKYFYLFILNFLSNLRRKFFSNVIYIILSLIIFYFLTLGDNYIFNKIFEIQNLFLEPLEIISIAFNFIFEARILLIILLVAFAIFYTIKDDKNKKKILYTISLVILSVAISLILKVVFSRERPYISYNPYNIFMWKSFSLKNYDNFFSLPSGHVITLVSTYIFWSGNSLKKILFYLTIVLVGFFRIYSLQHWPSDIFGAALFSLFMIVNNRDFLIEE